MINPINYFFKPSRRADEFFSSFLENECEEDLRHIAGWILKAEQDPELIPLKNSLFDGLRRKYNSENYQPSYRKVSKKLRKQYSQICARANGLLWLDSLVTEHDRDSRIYRHAYRNLRREINRILET